MREVLADICSDIEREKVYIGRCGPEPEHSLVVALTSCGNHAVGWLSCSELVSESEFEERARKKHEEYKQSKEAALQSPAPSGRKGISRLPTWKKTVKRLIHRSRSQRFSTFATAPAATPGGASPSSGAPPPRPTTTLRVAASAPIERMTQSKRLQLTKKSGFQMESRS